MATEEYNERRAKRGQAYNIAIRLLNGGESGIAKEDEEEIRRLVGQFHYGLEAQNDLYEKLKSLRLIN